MMRASSSLDESASSLSPPAYRLVAAGQVGSGEWTFRPVVLLRIVVALMIIAQLGRIPVISTGTSEAPLLVNDICVMALIAVVAVSGLASHSFRVDGVGGLALLFALIGFSSALLAVPRFGLDGMQLFISLAYLARWLVYFAVYLIVINVVDVSEVESVWRTLEAMILVFAAFGILQAIFLPHFAQLVYPESRVYVDWDEQGSRLVSTMLEPNIAGSMIMIVLLIQLAQLSGGERVPLWKPLLLFGALVATLSRSSFLALAVGGLMVLGVRGLSRRMLRFASIVGVLGVVAAPMLLSWSQAAVKLQVSDPSAMSRVVSWIRAFSVFADHPVLGIGFNTYGYVVEHYGGVRAGASSYSSDGGLLFIAVMTGVVGLACYLGILAVVVRRCRRIWRDASQTASHRSLAVGIAAATVAVCVHAAFVNSLLTPLVMEMLWVLWGLTFLMRHSVHGQQQASPRFELVAWRSRP